MLQNALEINKDIRYVLESDMKDHFDEDHEETTIDIDSFLREDYKIRRLFTFKKNNNKLCPEII